MKMEQVSKNCFAVLNQKNRMCDVNSHLINPGGGVGVDTRLQQDYGFNDIELALPTTLFDERHVLNLDGTEVDLIYVGPCYQVGDTIVHVPAERVLFAGSSFPITRHFEFESYFEHQNDSGGSSNRTVSAVGMVANLYF